MYTMKSYRDNMQHIIGGCYDRGFEIPMGDFNRELGCGAMIFGSHEPSASTVSPAIRSAFEAIGGLDDSDDYDQWDDSVDEIANDSDDNSCDRMGGLDDSRYELLDEDVSAEDESITASAVIAETMILGARDYKHDISVLWSGAVKVPGEERVGDNRAAEEVEREWNIAATDAEIYDITDEWRSDDSVHDITDLWTY